MVIASGYVISPDVNVMDVIADIMFTTILDAAYAAHGSLSLNATSSITDSDSLELDGAWGIATFESGGHTYAAVAAQRDDGVQILNITDPSGITAAGNITNSDSLELDGARGIALFESGGRTYAAVAAYDDDGVQILDITDPSGITAAGSITDGGSLELNGAYNIAIFESGGHTYAAVAAFVDNGVQILNITDPSSITAAGSIGDSSSRELEGAISITTFESGGHTYAAVAAQRDDGVQILNITDPSSITAAGSITDDTTLELDGPAGITTFKSGGHTYAAVAAYEDDGVQILDVTDPSGITAAGNITNSDSLELDGAWGITTFESGGHTYAAVAAYDGDGVQILDVIDPSSITAAGSITDDTTLELDGPASIATFESGGHTYAAVAAALDDGVQILRVDIVPDTTPPVITLAGSNPVAIAVGTPYTDAGATCIDNIDGSITPTSSSNVNANQIGTYVVTYSCTDAASNAAAQVPRTVIVKLELDTTPPVIFNATSSITDSDSLELDGAWGIAAFESGSHTYAAVATNLDDGVQILNITDPSGITAAGNITNSDSLELDGARGIALFESGGRTYAAVAAYDDDGVQILDITDPSGITAAGSITDGGSLELNGAYNIAIFESGGHTYAAVAAYEDDGVQILNVTDPSGITAAGSITDGGSLELNGAVSITTFKSGGHTYAAVAAYEDDGVQILNVTDPSSITAAGSITDDFILELNGAQTITIFKSGGHTYAAVAATLDDGVQILDVTDPSSITAAGSIGKSGSVKLNGAFGITTFESGGHTYAAVAANVDDSVQFLIVTDPSSITAAGSITDSDSLELDGARDIAIFESGGHTYAAVTAYFDDGIQIMRFNPDTTPPVITLAGPSSVTITGGDPYTDAGATCIDNIDGSITPTSSNNANANQIGTYVVTYSCTDAAGNAAQASRTVIVQSAPETKLPVILNATSSITDSSSLELDGARGIAMFESGGRTYAAVAAYEDDGVQILDVTNPSGITAAGSITNNGSLKLDYAQGIATFKSGSNTYAAVAAFNDDSVQILDVTNPSSITAAGSITDSDSLELNGAWDIATFESGGRTYAAVAASADNGVQILDVTNPSSITAAGSITDSGGLELDGARGIAIFESGGHTYAAVAAFVDDGVQILNVTDPSSITAAGSITDGGRLQLDGVQGITTFGSGGHTYAAVAGLSDNGVQILNVTNPSSITVASIIEDSTRLKLFGPASIATFEFGGHTYAAVAATSDDGVQILDVTNPSSIAAKGSITDGGSRELDGAWDIATFESGGSTYIAVAAYRDDGVQIMRVDIIDTTPPVITLAGSNLVTITGGDTYTDAGATCIDYVDGRITPTSSSNVNANLVGSYSVTYSCTDAAGNVAAQKSRTVIVQPAPDTTLPVTINAMSSITDGGSLKLDGARGVTTFVSGGHTYAAVAASADNGVQILNVTDPSGITAAGNITDGGSLVLDGAHGITTFVSGGRTYAAVAASDDDGVQILDVTNPSGITAAGSITDGGSLELDDAFGIAIFESGGRTYAAVTATLDDGVQILDVTDPSGITAAGSITDGGSLELNGARGITTFVSGGRTYAAVAATLDDGVQILDVTDPSGITAAGSITDSGSLELDGAWDIATFESGGRTYAAVAAQRDDGVQILDVTDPSGIAAAGSITDGGSLNLDSPQGIATFELGGHTYAAVAGYSDDGVQILDITNPSRITAAGSITDSGSLELDGPQGIAIFESGGHTYAAVAGHDDDGVQIIRVSIDTTPPVITLTGPNPVTTTIGVTYTDAGATCTDDVDGDITPTPSSNVDANQAGSYSVIYSCTDATGNAATQVSRTVIVSASDITPPVITLTGPNPVTTTIGVTYTDAGAACTDDVDGDITPTSSSDVNANQVGSYSVTYSCTDAASNAAQASRTVIVESVPDTTPPVITLTGLSAVTITVGATYTDAGATCTDGADGAITPTSSSTVNVNRVGSYSVTYSCTDAAGNAAQAPRTVTVEATHGVLSLHATSSITDGGSLNLDGPYDITTFESGGRTYAAVAVSRDNSVQILDVTDPSSVTATGSITDDSSLELRSPFGITTFESGGHTYAAVAAFGDDGVQILNVTNPSSITAAGSIGKSGSVKLDGAFGITTFESGGRTYAAVTAAIDDGVQILDVTNPSSITAASSITNSDSLELDGVFGIATFESGGHTYAAVAAPMDDGVQILNVTDPSSITAEGSIADGGSLELDGARGIAIFESDGRTYAAVTVYGDDSVQILDVTDPSNVTAEGSIADDGSLNLGGAFGIATFESGGHTYAAVAGSRDNGVQILDVTDPSSITAVGSINDDDSLALGGPYGIATFESGGHTYAAVAGYGNDGVQIIRVNHDTPPVITLAGSNPVKITVGDTYTDEGATCRDDADGAITPTPSSDVNANQAGSYSVTYSCTDTAGNAAKASRTVIVQPAPDTTPPVIILAGSNPVTITVGNMYTDDGAACRDDVDGAISPTSTSTVDAGQTGSYSVTYSCTDAAGNAAAQVSRTVIVQLAPDTTLFVIFNAASSITDGGSLNLDGAQGIATFESGGHIYAAVAAYEDDGVQILNITDPSGITAAGSITDGGNLNLDGAREIAIFESGGHTYAAVAAYDDDGVQILNVTDPSSITAAGSIGKSGSVKLDGAFGITTFESGGHTYAAVAAYDDDGVQILDVTDPSSITAAGSITDGGSLELDGAYGIATFESGGHTYAAVTANRDDGVQILNVTDPSGITAAGSITDGVSLSLDGAWGITTFESGGRTYAAVAAYEDDGVQILDVTDPSGITAAGSITNSDSLNLDGAFGIATFESGGRTYAAVAAALDDSVQILDVTNPSRITAAGSITDDDSLNLDGARGIAIFESGGHTYAAVAAYFDDGVQILRVNLMSDTAPPVITLADSNPVTITAGDTYTDAGATCIDDVGGSITPTSTSNVIANRVGSYSVTYSCTDAAGNAAQVSRTVIVQPAPDIAPYDIFNATSSITDLNLDGAYGITTFESGGRTYAAVAAYNDDRVQILDVTDPSGITAAGSITDDGSLNLDGARGIATFESGGRTYAAVAAYEDDGVQILDVTDPSGITAAGSITNSDSLELDGAWGITTFKSGGRTYAAVAAYEDDGVQILDVTDPSGITAAGNITNSDSLELDGAWGITTFESGGHTYAAVAAYNDDGVQILNVTDPPGITAAGSITDGGSLNLDGAYGITTFESGGRTYAAVTATVDDGIQILDVTDPSGITAAGSITDSDSLELDGAWGITTFESGGRTYAAVAAFIDDGVQILDVTDPSGITAAGSITNGDSLNLDGAQGIATFESGGRTYAAVTATVDDGVQILDVTDPSGITAAGSITDDDSRELDGAQGIATFESGGHTYAAVAAYLDDGVQILNVTDPSGITAAGSIADGGSLELNGARGITIFESGGHTYAAVAAYLDDGVQILNVTDPSGITAAGSITDGGSLELDGASGIAMFESGGHTYAAVAAYRDGGVQILNVTDPSGITAAGSITDGGSLELDGAQGIAIFESGGHTYAAVAAFIDDGVQILDITDPSGITAAGSITNGGSLELDGASGIAIFESGGRTYAAVAAYNDDGVQILDITDPSGITAAGSITDGSSLELGGAYGIAIFESGGRTYAAVAAYDDDGVQILEVTDPSGITAAGSITDGVSLNLDGASGIAMFESGGHTYAAVAAYNDDGVQIMRVSIDTAPPVITLTGSSPVTITVGDTYTDTGVTCIDDVGGSITPTSTSNVNANRIGSYSVTYSCTDAAGNAAQVSRTVIVQPAPDTTPTVIINATSSITDGGSLVLGGPQGIATFESGGRTYAAVAASIDGGVQILDVTDPSGITAAGSITNSDSLELDGAWGITTFESGGRTYAAVAAYEDDGVQILDVTDPSGITAAGNITNSDSLELDGAWGITTFESGGRTYVAVTANLDDGVQILDVTDPSGITAAGSITNSDSLNLDGPQGITIFESGGRTYAAVTANLDDGVQILDVTDPSGITAAGSITDDDSLELDGASGIATFESGGRTYAAVAAYDDDGVQILDVTDPSGITAAGSITDDDSLELDGANGIAMFESGGYTYAVVAASIDDGVQILGVADPSSITAEGSITDGGSRELDGAQGIAIFESGGHTYAAVAAYDDDGIQIMRVNIDTTPPVITLAGSNSVTITGGDMYTDAGATCIDDIDGAITPTPSSNVNTNRVGSYRVTYSCTDVTGNAAQASRTVIVQQAPDTTPSVTLKAISSIGDGGSRELDGARSIAKFESGGRTYVAVASYIDDGVQILDVTDPSRIIAKGSITDGGGGSSELDGAYGIALFKSGGRTYAAVAAYEDDGVQILDITDPSSITAAGKITDGFGGSSQLHGAVSITTFKTGGHTYAAVAAYDDNGVQILNVTNPSDISATDSITYDGSLKLGGVLGIATFKSGSHTYVAVAAFHSDGVQILNVTDPSRITAAGSITDSGSLQLNGASSIAIFESGDRIYAAVGSRFDNGIQILDVTDPSDITAAGSITDNDSLELYDPFVPAIFEFGGRTYAAVGAYVDDGVQILGVTNPSSITAKGSITDGGGLKLDGARGIATFVSGGHTYAAVAAYADDGVQILRVVMADDTTRPVITLTGSNPVTITVGDKYTDAGATCTDDVDVTITPTSSSTVNATQVGSYVVTYSCTDTAGNEAAEVPRTVIVAEDTTQRLQRSSSGFTPPVITLTGSNPVTITVNDKYTDAGATCIDDPDGAITPTSNSTVNANLVGSYVVTYSCSDEAGNEAQASRTVIVQVVEEYALASTLPLNATDIERPGPTISSNEQSPTNSHNITFTVDFGEQVDAGTFAASDVSASAGTVSDPLPANGTAGTFTFEVSDMAAGNLTVSIPEGGVLDLAGNNNTASDPYVIEIDRTRPAPVLSAAVSSPVNASSITFTVDFGEQVDRSTFDPSDVSASSGTVSDPLPANGTAGTFTFKVSDMAAGNLTVSIPEGGVLDLAGNNNTASNQLTLTVTRTPAGATPDAAFVTTWQTTSANESILIPVGDATGTYTVTWGDASIDADVSGHQMHTYKTAGTYTVSIYGDFSQIYLPYYYENSLKLQSIEQWGDIRWESMRGAFSGASNMVYRATDAPDLSAVTDTSEMFRFASSFNGNLSTWDVSSVTDASQMFAHARSFNGDMSSWNVSGMTDMSKMLTGTHSFARNLGDWYVVLDDTIMSEASETLVISAQNAYLDGQNPTYVVNDANFVVADGALAVKPGRSVLPGTYNVTVTVGGVIGEHRDTLHLRTIQITVEGDTAPPTILSAAYLTGNGTLTVTFSEPLDGTIHYDRIHIRDAGQSNGGISLDDAQIKRSSGPAVTVVLTAQQRADFALMATPQLDVGQGAVSDVAGNEVAAAVDQMVDTIAAVAGSGAFITTWTVGAGDSVTIPVGGSVATYDIDWGDGTVEMDVGGNRTHTYDAGGNYTVLISDDFERFYLNYYQAASKLASIDQWGDVQWTSMASAFAGASNMVYRATDAPDLSAVTDASEMFKSATSFNGDISDWDTSSVASMESMFSGATSFNGDISDWDVSGIANMTGMFANADSFAQNLGAWYVVLDGDTLSGSADSIGIAAQNQVLDGQNPTYTIDGTALNGDKFWIVNGSHLAIRTDQTVAQGQYNVTIKSTGSFGVDNSRVTEITVSEGVVLQTNNPPSVEAGHDQTVRDGATVTLAGSATDSDEDVMTYLWTHNSTALGITLANATSPSTTFTAPQVDSDTYIVFTLTVNDGTATSSDSVSVTITRNNPPSVEAGPAQTVQEGSTVALSGTASDPDGNSLTYLWSHDSTTNITFSDPSSLAASFAAPQVDSNTTITITLTVSDGNLTASDSVDVTITDVPAQVSQSDPRGVYHLTLTSTESGVIEAVWDVPGEVPVDYRMSWAKAGESFRTWTDLSGNAFPTGASHTITGLEEGEEYKVKVRARYGDGSGPWSDAYTVTVAGTAPDQPANSPPVVDAGDSQTVQEGSTVALSGTASDPDGNSLTYLWSHDSTTNITFSDPSSLAASFAAPQVDSNTTITITLTVSDGNLTASDSVDVTITDVPAQVSQSDPRGVYHLTLTSTESGVIEAVWNAPTEAPTDYRISWAKAGESFRTWTDLSGNAFPTGASHTITDLEEGEEYKVVVRARYDGSSGDWSGEITVTVARTG